MANAKYEDSLITAKTMQQAVDQTRFVEKEVAVLGLSSLEIEDSDSLDAHEKVGAHG